MPQKISFQGAPGAYSDMACRAVYPRLETLPCETFEEAFEALKSGLSDLAMIPVDNTLAGRVADVHHLLPKSGVYIIGEHFQPIHHALLGIKGAKLTDIKEVHSHVHAIPQCRKALKELGLKAYIHADTAGAAKEVAEKGDKTLAAIASPLAGEIYGLDILRDNMQDTDTNTTRFLILSREAKFPKLDKAADKARVMTSFYFEVRNIPAALYKALGGFATNGVQMVKLESYIDAGFNVAKFYAEVLGHPDERNVGLALEELAFFAKDIKIMGAYNAHSFRFKD